jgi:uncharacterized protein YjbI with pentapeptide repeats
MNQQLENLSPSEKRHWLLQQLKQNEQGHFYKIRAIEGQNLNDIDLSNIDFESLKVGSCLSFRNCQLQRANFAGCTLKDVSLEGANLEAAHFSQSTLIRCQFSGNLRHINLTKSSLIDVTMKDCDLSHSNWEKTQINGSFAGSNLEYANFTEAIFFGVNFSHVNLSNSCFCNAIFKSPEVDRQHKLYQYSFRQSSLNHSDFSNVIFQVPVSFAAAKLKNTNFSEVDFTQNHVSFYATDLTDALMPLGWFEQISKDKIELANLPNGTLYQKNNTQIISPFKKLSLFLKKLFNWGLWLVLLSACLVILTGILRLVYQGGMISFWVAPIVLLVFAIFGYTKAQAKAKTATNSWDYSFLLFGFPLIVFLLELPFILLGILLGNIPLLAVIFYSLLLGIPMAIVFVQRGYRSLLFCWTGITS